MENLYISTKDLKKFAYGKDKVFIDDNNCHNWQGISGTAKVNRYGSIRLYDSSIQSISAHRMAYYYYNGPYDNSLVVRHVCDNPKCINPYHLVLGTQYDNIIDKCNRKRITFDHHKLNTEAVKVIKWMLKYRPKRGLAARLARLHKVGDCAISAIKKNQKWIDIHV